MRNEELYHYSAMPDEEREEIKLSDQFKYEEL